MTMFKFMRVGFDSSALYNILPVPPTETDERYGMRVVSDSFQEKTATLLFVDEEARDKAVDDFITALNLARAA